MAFTQLKPLFSHQVLRWASGLSAAMALIQGILAIVLGTQPENVGVRHAHSGLGIALIVVSLVAAVVAYRYGKESNRTGLFAHGLAIFILCLVQYAIGEMGLVMLHIGLGIAILVGAIALFTLALRRPYVVTGAQPTAQPTAEPGPAPRAPRDEA